MTKAEGRGVYYKMLGEYEWFFPHFLAGKITSCMSSHFDITRASILNFVLRICLLMESYLMNKIFISIYRNSFHGIKTDCLALSSVFQEFTLTFTRRLGNRVAHELASLAFDLHEKYFPS